MCKRPANNRKLGTKLGLRAASKPHARANSNGHPPEPLLMSNEQHDVGNVEDIDGRLTATIWIVHWRGRRQQMLR